MQPFKEIEESYNNPDPWGYQSNRDDILRRDILIDISKRFGPYERCLDIGAGEGWITKMYPAKEIFGYELSHQAAARFPPNVNRATVIKGKYDLICATGVFYRHYDWRTFLNIIKTHASKHVLVSSIEDWEIPEVNKIGKVLYETRYKYRDWNQRTRMFEV